jgi:vacuolar-type H+-ATPase subunit H
MERLVSKEEVYVRAREEAQKLIEEARQEARRTREDADRYGRETRQDAERYAMKVLNGMEGELNRILAIIKKGQDSLGVDRD